MIGTKTGLNDQEDSGQKYGILETQSTPATETAGDWQCTLYRSCSYTDHFNNSLDTVQNKKQETRIKPPK